MKNKFIAVVGISAVVLAALFFYNKYQVAPKIKFQSLELTDLNGNSISLDSFQNKKLFINFFATWCGPCISELPSLENAQQILAKDNIKFLLISDEPVEQLKYLQQKIQLPVLHSNNKLSSVKIFTLPTSYLLNERQEIIFKKTGATDWGSETTIEELHNALH